MRLGREDSPRCSGSGVGGGSVSLSLSTKEEENWKTDFVSAEYNANLTFIMISHIQNIMLLYSSMVFRGFHLSHCLLFAGYAIVFRPTALGIRAMPSPSDESINFVLSLFPTVGLSMSDIQVA